MRELMRQYGKILCAALVLVMLGGLLQGLRQWTGEHKAVDFFSPPALSVLSEERSNPLLEVEMKGTGLWTKESYLPEELVEWEPKEAFDAPIIEHLEGFEANQEVSEKVCFQTAGVYRMLISLQRTSDQKRIPALVILLVNEKQETEKG